jgi:hypothetical protein
VIFFNEPCGAYGGVLLEYLQSLMLEQIKEKAEKACRKRHESNQTFEVLKMPLSL